MIPLRLLLAVLAFTPLLPVVSAQAPRPARPPENVKVLTELDGQALRTEMQRIATALGVECGHCHVQGNFASDEKRPKRSARWMLELTRALNAQHFSKYEIKEGESVLGRVTCFTCHQGGIAPATAPPPK